MNVCDLLLDDYDSEEREKKNLKATDEKLNSSRIYSLGLREEEGEVKCVARYKLGFAFFKYAENRVDYITSFPCHEGAIGECFMHSPKSCMLDSMGNINVFDLRSRKLLRR